MEKENKNTQLKVKKNIFQRLNHLFTFISIFGVLILIGDLAFNMTNRLNNKIPYYYFGIAFTVVGLTVITVNKIRKNK